jgi:NADH dehydrogenase
MGQRYGVQPVFVEDVARAFAESLENEKTIGEVFPTGGAEKMTWPAMHRIASEIVTGKARPTLPIPAWYARMITKIVPAALLPFTDDQVLMSQQENTCNLSKFVNAFGWTPRPFGEALREYTN